MKVTLDPLKEGKKIYFASDFHLGSPNAEKSALREAKIINWLESIQHDAQAIFLVGDIFDFWFEYKYVVPKGFLKFLAKITQLKQSGIDIYFFIGNHDVWMFDYFTKELGIPVYREPIQFVLSHKKFFLGHGDGLGPGDNVYKVLKKVFHNKVIQFLYKWLIHPDIGMWFGNTWSGHSRSSKEGKEDEFLGEKEFLLQYCREQEQIEHFDYFVFGHRHLMIDVPIGEKSRYINLGDWFKRNSYAVFDGHKLELLCYTK